MTKQYDWGPYIRKHRNYPAYPNTVKALTYVTDKNHALDLGAGSLRDTYEMLRVGISEVDAVDMDREMLTVAKEVGDPRIITHVTKFDEFEYTPNKYDFVNAQRSLFFLDQDEFEYVWDKIFTSLKPGGIFVGNLAGMNHSWNGTNPKVPLYFSKQQVEDMCKGYKIIMMDSPEWEKETQGEMLHWHLIEFILRKK